MKLIAFFLTFYMLVGSLIPRTDFSQLIYLGNLKAHYSEHKAAAAANNETLSFLEFCYIHFIDSQQHSDDNHEEDHQQLPFQTINSIFALDIAHFTIANLNELFIFSVEFRQYISPFHLRGFASKNYQPPSC